MDYAIKNKAVLVAKDLEFGNRKIFQSDYGIIIFRLLFFFKTSQFISVLKDFLTSIDLSELAKSIVIVKLDEYRIKKLNYRK